ncbi:hypothetical protein BS47DRAFT_1383059 [Hydnum rufescens UP504]|uniref:Uncharacterized protein n=1 Tax=Hydnum rufescens UP504 TaxID=1448309 RepID=A0A9P6AUQ2_9AGAM|nr:hypothetical protein BS47DRAFT_1383059 [Hydnum rufescens UP504]
MKRRTMYTTQRKSCIRPRSRTNVVRQYDTLNGKTAITCPTVDYLRCTILTVPANVGKTSCGPHKSSLASGKFQPTLLNIKERKNVARKQKVTQRRQYRELIDIARVMSLRNNENRIQRVQSETRRRSCIIRFKGHCRFANHTEPRRPRT